MAEYGRVDASIPLSGRKPDTFGKLSELINMQRASTEAKTAKVQLRSAEQSQRQREGIAGIDWSKYNGSDGTTDLNKFFSDPDIRERAGDQWQQLSSQAIGIKQQQLAAKQTLLNLNQDQFKTFADMVGGFRSDPDVINGTPAGKEKMTQALGQYITMFGPDVENVVKAYAGPLINAPAGSMNQVLQNIQMQATSAGEQLSKQKPEYMSTGGEARDINPLTPSGTAPPAVPMTIAPGQQSEIVTDQAGIPLEQRRDPRGNITGVRPVAGMPTYRPGDVPAEASQTETNQRIITSNRAAADKVPEQLYSIDSAMKIADDLGTGGGVDFARKRASLESGLAAFIPGLDTAVNDATKLQLMDKYLERVAASSSQLTGAPDTTDAARESISRQNASIGYTPDAIKNVLTFARSQAQAVSAKAKAQERWLENNGTSTAHKFETKWRENYDPRIFILEALPDDKAAEYIKDWKPGERTALKEKVKALREMGAIK